MAVAKGDLKAALVAEKEANFYRSRASSATSNGTKTINFLLTPSLKAEDLGFTDKNRKQIAKKSNDGFLYKLNR